MIESFKTCDRCKLRETMLDGNTPTQFLQVGFSLNGLTRNNQDWCRACVMSVGLLTPSTESDKKVAPPSPPTLEQQLADILKTIIAENT